MNSRDIQEEPKIKKGYLEDIYSLQKGLLKHYQEIENLPSYPVDVNTKSSQILLKDFTARIIEELAEGFESHLSVVDSTVKNCYWDKIETGDTPIESYEAMLNDLQNIGEEQSDALHFFMELLIYANIGPEDLASYLQTKYNVRLNSRDDFDLLTSIQIIGESIIKHRYPQVSQMNPMNVIDVIKPKLFNHPGLGTPHKDLRFFICGCEVNLNMMPFYKQILWDITYHLNISRNFLKNKPWKQSEVMTQELAYQRELVEAFILFIGYLGTMQCIPQQIYFLYFKKNKINEFRIKSKY